MERKKQYNIIYKSTLVIEKQHNIVIIKNLERRDLMTDRDIRKLSRRDLLQMLIEQSQEVQALREKLAEAEKALEDKTIAIDNAGSIAEAALRLSGIFQAAQDASQQYIDNVRKLTQRQEEDFDLTEEQSLAKAKRILEEAEEQRTKMERDTKAKCGEMLREARLQSQAYWNDVSEKMKNLYNGNTELRKMLSTIPPPKELE